MKLNAQVDLISLPAFLPEPDCPFYFLQFDADGKLAKALDARPLTNLVKDLEARMKGEHKS